MYKMTDEELHRRRARRRRPSAQMGLFLAVLMTIIGAAGVITAADRQIENVDRIEDLEDILVAVDGPAVNYLLIGSDSREEVSDGSFGDASQITGRRSDTIMILRQEADGNGAAILSLNRDLWVTMADTGREDRINSAYNRGADVLAATITQEFGIPINHVVDVDFEGFQDIVDATGGTELCFEYSVRDFKANYKQPSGCHVLDGEQALAYARSRTWEEFRDGEWQSDGRSDLGRVERQQYFIRQTANETLRDLAADPFLASDIIAATADSVRIDNNLDPLATAGTLRKAFSVGLSTYTLPTEGVMIDGKAVLLVVEGPETDAILNYFRGVGPPPPDDAATTEPTVSTGR
jgi:LCP family protein required for cell wall assembly